VKPGAYWLHLEGEVIKIPLPDNVIQFVRGTFVDDLIVNRFGPVPPLTQKNTVVVFVGVGVHYL
jgi:hypothetical protein